MDYSNIDYDSTFDIIGTPENYINKYENLKIQKKNKAALLCLNNALKAFPTNFEIAAKLFDFLFELKKYNELIKFSNFILVNNQNKIRIKQCYGIIACCYFFLNDFKNALDYFEKSEGYNCISTEMPMTYYQAICYEKYGKYNEALNLLTKLYNFYNNTIMEVEKNNSNPDNTIIRHNITNKEMQLLTDTINRIRMLSNQNIIYEI